MKEYTTPTGKVLQIEPASFEDACDLNSAICEKLLESNISLSLVIQEIISSLGKEKVEDISRINFSDIVGNPTMLELMSRTFLSLLSSASVRNKILKCLEKSLLNKERITLNSFNDLSNRQDYIFLFKKCIEVNILCFIPALS